MKTADKKPTKFDTLVAQAVKTLKLALQESRATDLSLNVYASGSKASTVSMYFEERELEGTVGVNGVRLGRKP